MSFREVRSFTETMKSLGYPRMISLDNFRTPNFELVADCLHWLIQRFYPECSISDDISTEADRIKFLQSAAQIMLTKARMKLNLKKLYAADGSAVRELLKLAALLYKATQTATSIDEDPSEASDPAVALKLLDASAATAAAAEVARTGVALYDGLLAEGQQLRDARTRALAAAHDTSMVEAGIQETITGLTEALNSLSGKLTELSGTEGQLAARLDKRRAELERAEKRLATLAGVRPAYMDEYEALQGQLQVLWLHYLERFRNLQYLEAQLDGYHKAEQDAADAAERRRKKLQKRLAEEELRILRGEAAVDETHLDGSRVAAGDSDSEDDNSEDDSMAASDSARGAAAASMRGRMQQQQQSIKQQQLHKQQQQQNGQATKVMGSLTAGGQWDDEDDSIDDDTATDGGEVSRAGSDVGGPGAAGMQNGVMGYGDELGGGGRISDGLDDGFSDGAARAPESEDSGF